MIDQGDLTPSSLRFSATTAAEEFVLTVLPFRDPESRVSLRNFLQVMGSTPLAPTELNALLLECLSVLDRHTGSRLPRLPDAYLARRRKSSDCVAAFEDCLRELFAYRITPDGVLRTAIAQIEAHFEDPQFSWRGIANLVGVSRTHLCDRFKRQIGKSPGEYLRQVRLDKAAILLATTMLTVKETWARVGYNSGSHFDHDFKARFDVSPVEYRARADHLAALAAYGVRSDARVQTAGWGNNAPGNRSKEFLIADDDDVMRYTTARYLEAKGYGVVVAQDGEAVLREADRASLRAVLLDYHLPDMLGLECLRAIRLRRRTSYLRVVICTADWEVMDHSPEIRALDASVQWKPCDLDEIEALLVDRRPGLGS